MSKMGWQLAVSTLGLLFVGAGCGGRVVSDGSFADSGAAPPRRSGDAATSGSGSGSGSSFGGTVALPACHPGFLPGDEPARPCSYMYDGRCYETKTDACSCACPNRSGTTCTSGFPQVNGKVEVTCG